MAARGEAGIWKGTEFRIHLMGSKNDEVDVRVARKKEPIVCDRGSGNLIVRSKLPRRVGTGFTRRGGWVSRCYF